MKNIEKIRPDFSVYVVDDEESIRSVLLETFKGAGYQVEAFANAEDALAKIKTDPPHLVFSDIRMPGMSGIQLLEKVRELSSDIEYVIMTSHASLETAVNAMKLGAYDYIYKPFDSIADVIKTADRTIERIYMKFENEQLLAELADKNKILNTVNQKISQENKEIQLINGLMQRLAQTLDPDGVIRVFLDSISEITDGKPAIFFKFLPSHMSLIAGGASKIPFDQVKSVGLSLKQFEPQKIVELLMQPLTLRPLHDLMREVFKVEAFDAVPFVYQNQPAGVFCTFGPIKDESLKRLLESYLQITRVSFDNAMMAKRIREMAIKDPLTTLYNRRYFNEKLEEELFRSRRTKYPLSLIYLDIDHFKKYNDQNGHPMGDTLLRAFSALLIKTSRKTDIVARLGGEEFAVICPNTPREGAAIKAEKIRLAIEATKFPFGEKQPLGKVTCSLGVSEYPRIASDGEGLVRSADDCLYQVKQAGRNQVCMAEAPVGFVPDFEPLPVPKNGEISKPSSGQDSGSAA